MRAFVCLCVLSGCYNTYQIRPDELAKLNRAYANEVSTGSVQTSPASTSASGGYRPATYAPVTTTVQVHQLITPDGTTVEVRGQPSVTIQTSNGVTMKFDHPVMADRVDEETIVLRGANLGETRIRLADISSASLTVYDSGSSNTALAVVVGVVCLAILLAAMP